jgi:flagellar biosynthetic protein FliP
MHRAASRLLLLVFVATAFLVGTPAAMSQEAEPVPAAPSEIEAPPVQAPLVEVPAPAEVPDVSISVSSDSGGLSQTVTIILLLTVAGVAPGLLLLTTSFTRFAIVLGLTRNAIGVQTIPPSQVLIGLSLLLTTFVMGPIFGAINDNALQPLLNGEIEQAEAIEEGFAPLREFMLAQTRPEDLRLFMGLSGGEQPETPDDVAATTLIPAFVISELRAAFIIGFIIFVPFLVIDLIVAAVLMSMGMVMLPPVFISLPLKLLLFVLVDGWAMIIGSVVQSVQGVA